MQTALLTDTPPSSDDTIIFTDPAIPVDLPDDGTLVRRDPLRAFGPDGELIALSYDAKTWVQTPTGRALDDQRKAPVQKDYKAKVAAVLINQTPSFERRVMAPFAGFGLGQILAGWAQAEYLGELPAGELDVLMLPGIGVPRDVLLDLKAKVKGIVLDLDEPTPGGVEDPVELGAVAALADVITVPTTKMAEELRKRHPSVFVVPPVIDMHRWKGLARRSLPEGQPLRIGVTNPTKNRELELALNQVMERFSERIELIRYDWWALTHEQERALYPSLDIAVIGSLGTYNSVYPALVAAAGGTAIIAGRGYGRTVNHGHSGLVAGRDTDHKAWRRAITDLLMDNRQREVLGRNARNELRSHLAQQQVSQLILPYKLLVTGEIKTSQVQVG